jgi:hypothetical protein
VLVEAQTVDRTFIETTKYIVTETVFLALLQYLEVFLYQFSVKFDASKSKFKLSELLDALRDYILPVSEYCTKLLACVPEKLQGMFTSKTTNCFDSNLKSISDSWSVCLESEFDKVSIEGYSSTTTTTDGTKLTSSLIQLFNESNLATIFKCLWKGYVGSGFC